MNNELIKLITVTGCQEDRKGLGINEVIAEVEVFAGIKSVGRTEYYEALRNGIDLKIIFSINPDDFKLADKVIDGKKISASKITFDGEEFLIKRTYVKNMFEMELMCGKVE